MMGQDLVAPVKYSHSRSTQNLGNQRTAIPNHMPTLHPDKNTVTAHNSIGSHWSRPNIANHYLCNHTAADHRFSHKSHIIADSILGLHTTNAFCIYNSAYLWIADESGCSASKHQSSAVSSPLSVPECPGVQTHCVRHPILVRFSVHSDVMEWLCVLVSVLLCISYPLHPDQCPMPSWCVPL